jgi:hypothetical protein
MIDDLRLTIDDWTQSLGIGVGIGIENGKSVSNSRANREVSINDSICNRAKHVFFQSSIINRQSSMDTRWFGK